LQHCTRCSASAPMAAPVVPSPVLAVADASDGEGFPDQQEEREGEAKEARREACNDADSLAMVAQVLADQSCQVPHGDSDQTSDAVAATVVQTDPTVVSLRRANLQSDVMSRTRDFVIKMASMIRDTGSDVLEPTDFETELEHYDDVTDRV